MRRPARVFLTLLLLAIALPAAWVAYFWATPLRLPSTPFDFTVRSGSSLKSVSSSLTEAGLLKEPYTFWILGRALGKAPAIQAGTYRLEKAVTPVELLEKLARGDVLYVEIAFIEGTTFRQWLAQLRSNRHVKQTLPDKSEAQILAALGIDERSPEGWFFPDRYRFAPGVTDVEILKRAHAAMKKKLAEAWAARDPAIALSTPYEALILASIVEKETGAGEERPLIASVFTNRLKKGMRLQTDPTVIYGMGAAYEGNIRKKDLLADTPWNTYTRDGLPPTPIAMPGAAALQAVTRPAESDYLYFVSRKDGTHQFSRSLEEHNRAVAKFQLSR
jgi:UPF0755 protein